MGDEGNDNTEDAQEVVHLGFVEDIQDLEHLQQVAFRSPDYNVWDGGQLGGAPSWLNPSDVPQGPMRSPDGQIMSLLCQIYAPVDELLDDGDHESKHHDASAFHRAVYVFGCGPKGQNEKPCIRVLRVQLSQENPFYPYDPEALSSSELESWQSHFPEDVHLCQICGLRAAYKCPRQNQYFCCKEHQKEYFRYVFHPQQQQKQGQQLPVDQDTPFAIAELPSLYPIAEIVVEQESLNGESESSTVPNTMFPQSTSDGDDSDSDEDLEQEDLNRMVRGGDRNGTSYSKKKQSAAVSDPTTAAFLDRCRPNPDQVLRYSRWKKSNRDAPLWFREADQLASRDDAGANASPPPCPYCGASRKFEFQLMPQMIHFLLRKKQNGASGESKIDPELERQWKQVLQSMQEADTYIEHASPENVSPRLVEAKEKATQQYQQAKLGDKQGDLDFGIVSVYTCTRSCSGSSNVIDSAALGAYREEYAWVQTSMGS